MSWDNHKNFAISTVATAPSPATSGTALVVASGDGALFPAGPFNAVAWPSTDPNPTAANAEIVRVTARSTDTFTITRAQESTTAKSIAVGWNIALVLSVKVITDLESAIDTINGVSNQPLDSDLTAIAGLTPSNDDIIQRKAGAWTNRTMAQLISDLAGLGTTFQPLDSDLTAIAALSTTSYGRALLALADAAALRTAAGLVIGTDVEAHDADLTTIAGLSPSNDDVLQRKSGAWTNRTMAQLLADLGIVTGSGWDAVIKKASNSSVASNSTPAADSELTYAGVNGGTYEFEATLLYDSPAGGSTPDLKMSPAEDATTRGHYIAQGFGTGDSLSATSIQIVGTLGTTSWGTGASQREIMVKGTWRCGGGSLAIYWSQNTSGVNATRLLIGSVLRVRRVV